MRKEDVIKIGEAIHLMLEMANTTYLTGNSGVEVIDGNMDFFEGRFGKEIAELAREETIEILFEIYG